jgi:hypothetical protein
MLSASNIANALRAAYARSMRPAVDRRFAVVAGRTLTSAGCLDRKSSWLHTQTNGPN